MGVVFEVGTVASRDLAVPDPDVAWFAVDADVDCELLVAPKRVRVLPRRRSGTVAMMGCLLIVVVVAVVVYV
jgi:hypothetical protein